MDANEIRSGVLAAAAHLLTAASHLVLIPGTQPGQVDELCKEAAALTAKAQE